MTAPTLLHLTDAQVSELADGTLDSRAQPVLLAHLVSCVGCRTQVAETRALIAWSRGASGGITAPPELWPLVASATIHAPRRSVRTVLRLTRVLLVVAFAILAVSLALSLRARLRDASPPATAAGAHFLPAPPHAERAPRSPAPPPAPAPNGQLPP